MADAGAAVMTEIILAPVEAWGGDATHFLYELLQKRPPGVSISHKRMPTFAEHELFVKQHPYLSWFLIVLRNEVRDGDDKPHYFNTPVGSCYLTDRYEIGIHLADGYRGKGYGTEVIELLKELYPGQRLLANVAPGNEASMWLFTRRGFKLVQHTYALEP
jgi:RimJ/RimL family protein N-acetyltransferase